MELIVIGIVILVGSVVLAGAIWIVIWKAMGNILDWIIHAFGNERAAAEIEEKWRRRQQRDVKQ
ncbi:MAG: hypothetical protein M3N53_03490 [Actinomycetota bacterium]|nr:hypothetical protein [Actinomycetota bacterium]